MLAANKTQKPVKAVLRLDMVIGGERMEKGDVVELPHREFVYLANHERVAEATGENVAAVKAEIAAAAEAAKKTTKSRIEELEAELAQLKKGSK